jgi:hypothetical protein
MADRPTTTTLEEAKEAGYLGTPVDQTDRNEYTVAGQAKRNVVQPGEPAGTDATVSDAPVDADDDATATKSRRR